MDPVTVDVCVSAVKAATPSPAELQAVGTVLAQLMFSLSLVMLVVGLVLGGLLRPITRALWRLARLRAARQRRQGYITLFGRRYVKGENGKFVREETK